MPSYKIMTTFAPNQEWELTAGSNKGCAHIYLGRGHTSPQHPIILAAGFDSTADPTDVYTIVNLHATAEKLRARGYDIIIVTYGDSTQSIVNNAAVFRDCVERAKKCTTNPLIAGGLSMGGLVSRWALAEMESQHCEHQCRIYLSIDTPHQGAYTCLAAQWMAQTFSQAGSALASGSVALLNSTANQQFLSHFLTKDSVGPSALREAFMEQLQALGNYPKLVERLAIASGRGDGICTLQAEQPLLSAAGSGGARAVLWALPENGDRVLVADGGIPGVEATQLSVSSPVAWEGVPGGRSPHIQDAAQIGVEVGMGLVNAASLSCCAVPTVSALDIALDPRQAIPPAGEVETAFDDYIFCEQDERHMHFTQRVSDWLIGKLGLPISTTIDTQLEPQ